MKKLLSIIALAMGLMASEPTFTIDDLWAVEYLDTDFDNEHRLFIKPTPDYSAEKGKDAQYNLMSEAYAGGMAYKFRFHDVNNAWKIISWYNLIPFINSDDRSKPYVYQCKNGCDPYIEHKKAMKEKYFNDEYVNAFLSVVNSDDMLERLEPLRKGFIVVLDKAKEFFGNKQNEMVNMIDTSTLTQKRKDFYKEKVNTLFATELEYIEYTNAQFMRYIFDETSGCGGKTGYDANTCIREKIAELIKPGENKYYDERDYQYWALNFYERTYNDFFAQDRYSLEKIIKKETNK